MAKTPNITTAPTGNIPPFGLRMLPELRAQIEAAAKASGRSMNAEIVARLQSTFDAASKAGHQTVTIDMDAAERALERLVKDSVLMTISEQLAALTRTDLQRVVVDRLGEQQVGYLVEGEGGQLTFRRADQVDGEKKPSPARKR